MKKVKLTKTLVLAIAFNIFKWFSVTLKSIIMELEIICILIIVLIKYYKRLKYRYNKMLTFFWAKYQKLNIQSKLFLLDKILNFNLRFKYNFIFL